MKIKLNLLPEKRAKEIKKKSILRFIIWQEIVVIFMVVMFLIMIKGIDVVVNLRLSSLEQQLSSQKLGNNFKEIDKYKSNLQNINKKLFLIEQIQQDSVDWLNVFDYINEATPNNITIKSIRNDNHIVTIMGVATTRDQLILFRNNLNKADCFTEINVPLNDIVLKRNIDFQINFKINKSCLSNYEK